jgi:putative membrane protein
MKRTGFICLALVTALTLGCNTERRDTAGGGAVGTSGADTVSRGDRDFVNDAALTNMAEIELGRLASERGVNAEVKSFGQMMVDDHTKGLENLKTVASRHNIPMPAALDDEHNELRDKLAKLQGAEFDREYASAMVEGHEAFVDKLESRLDSDKQAKKSDDPIAMAINELAAKTYPTTSTHLEKARALDKAVRTGTTN